MAALAGVGYSTLYAIAKREGWPAGHARTSPVAKALRPARTVLRDPGYTPSGQE